MLGQDGACQACPPMPGPVQNARVLRPLLVLVAISWLLGCSRETAPGATAQAAELPYTAADGSIKQLPIWVIEGDWKPERLTTITGRTPDKQKAGELPEQVEPDDNDDVDEDVPLNPLAADEETKA